jgi:hypothetical protein
MGFSFITARLIYNLWETTGNEQVNFYGLDGKSNRRTVIIRSNDEVQLRLNFISGLRMELTIIHKKLFNLFLSFDFHVEELFDYTCDEYYLNYEGGAIHILQCEFDRKKTTLKIYKKTKPEDVENYLTAFAVKYA